MKSVPDQTRRQVCITLPPHVHDTGRNLARKRGLPFSVLVQLLVEEHAGSTPREAA